MATLEGGNPFEKIGAFLILMGFTYRLLFPSMSSTFFDNGVAAIIIFSGLAALLASMIRPHAERFRVNLASGALVLFVVTNLLAGRSSGYFRAAAGPVTDLAALAALFTAVSGRMFKRRDARQAAAILAAITVIAAAVGFYQYFYSFPAMRREMPTLKLPGWVEGVYIDEKSVEDFKTRILSQEIFSTFFTSNVFAGFLALMLPVTLGLGAGVLKGSGPRRRRGAVICLALAAAEAWLLVLTKSKGGLGALAVGLCVLAVLLLYRYLPKKVFVAAVAAAIVIIAASGYFAFPRAKQFYYEARTSYELRLGYWRATWRMIKAEPLLGAGPGNFAREYFAFKDIGEREVKNPHNAYLLVWTEGGVFTLVFFLAFWVLVFAGPRGREAPSTAPTARFVAASILSAAVLYSAVYSHSVFAGFLPPAVPILGGAILGALLILAFSGSAVAADEGLVIAGLTAGLAAFLAACAVDVTFSDTGTAAAAVFAAAAISPRGRRAALKAGTRPAFAIAGIAAVGLVLFVALLFVPRTRAESAMSDSTSYMIEGDLNKARDSAILAAAWDKRDPAPLVQIGRIYEIAAGVDKDPSGDLVLAEKFYKEAAAVDCRGLAAHEGLARVYSAQGSNYFPKALAEYDALLRLYPMNSQYNIGAAKLFEKSGGPRAALEHYRRALAIDDKTLEHGMQLSPEERVDVEASVKRLQAAIAEKA